jgi:hypothetical protein
MLQKIGLKGYYDTPLNLEGLGVDANENIIMAVTIIPIDDSSNQLLHSLQVCFMYMMRGFGCKETTTCSPSW